MQLLKQCSVVIYKLLLPDRLRGGCRILLLRERGTKIANVKSLGGPFLLAKGRE